MQLVTFLYVATVARLAELRREAERGDSPVPTAVIIAGLVAAGIAVTALVKTKAEGWINDIPTK
ncbi:hypothetical protein AB0M91_01365 [Micromonospora rifamycinica]|uniref:Uncharacterized protein n=1 Tax=Micromonospora rifamycinica TaxID=291594 RepID=A0A109ILC0_9ACTN|nr:MULTISPECIES: hypothetical protein [Micromonospora]KWV32685.1 hypothetical protein AWV63_10915 [Micromonospora rifamycinica]WFE63344.1 hypothetical protein O7625_08625 [Micromonospora sp. WMMD714]SCG70227.1 hypothetical protein GA0070623_3497 [Micromonospora rifamycinica]